MTLPLLYQLQNASYSSLNSSDFRIAVIDPDDSGLSAGQVGSLRADNKMLLAYTSIGEAEDYRSYWSDGKWNTSPPDFLLRENPNWKGNFLVKFWDNDWQKIIIQRVDDAIKQGYNGIYLDIVDGYTVAQVKSAYSGTNEQLRQEMIDFVVKISDYAKSKNPDFLVVPQNAVGLLSKDENNPDGPANTRYLNAIDGLGVEDLWYDGNSNSGWTSGDLQYISHALAADKFVLATSYPTDSAKQATFISKAIDAGLIPFAADRDLTGKVSAINNTVEQKLTGEDVMTPWSKGVSNNVPNVPVEPPVVPDPPKAPEPPKAPQPTTPEPDGDTGETENPGKDDEDKGGQTPPEKGKAIVGTAENDKIAGTGADDTIKGKAGHDRINGNAGDDNIRGDNGNDRIFAGDGEDKIRGGGGDDKIYGGADRDIIHGDAGNDILIGNLGNDLLRGGTGNDILIGGRGSDSFHFAPGMDSDVIRDFEDGVDVIKFHGSKFDDPFDHAREKGNDVVFDFGNGDVLRVEDVTLAQLQDDLFLV